MAGIDLTLENDYEKLMKKVMAYYKSTVDFRHNQFQTFIDMAKRDMEFTCFKYITRGDLLGYQITYKDYADYCLVVWFSPALKSVNLHVVADPDNNCFAGKDPTNGDNVIKYFDLAWLGEGETVESRCERILKLAKEEIEDMRELAIKMKVDHCMTAEQFTEKVQDLMHPDNDSYLFVDPISSEQANKWFYDTLVEKIKAHPKIWKWFFTV